MKQEEIIKEGEKIQIEIDKDEDSSQYLSSIEEVIDDQTYVISRPIGGEEYTYLDPGQIIRVMYFRAEAAYYFDAEIIERMKSDDVISARISAVSDRYKLQRRNYFRLRMMVPVTLSFIPQGSYERTVKKFDTVDISGGGLKIVSDSQITTSAPVAICVGIPHVEHEVIRGRVVRSAPSSQDINIYETAIEFTQIENNARQLIIKYIFAKQRELIKKGMR